MATTNSNNFCTIDDQYKSYSYPRKLADIPYASFIRIKKYSYDKGMAEVGKNQNDVLGAFQDSKLMKNLTEGISDKLSGIYSDGDSGQSYQEVLGTDDEQQAIDRVRADNSMWGTRLINPGNIWGWDRRTDDQIKDLDFELRDGTTTDLNQLLQEKQDVINFRDQGYEYAYCNLPLPLDFQYGYDANWNNTFKLGTMALAADDPGRLTSIVAAGGLFGGAIEAMNQANDGGFVKNDKFQTNKFNNQIDRSGYNWSAIITDGVRSGAETAGNLFKVNSNIFDPTNVVGMAGLAPNENAIQFFKKMEFRSFTLNFEFAARNKNESKDIQDIIKWFKIGMHPTTQDIGGSGSGVLLGFPDIFVLEPRFVPGTPKGDMTEAEIHVHHPMMPSTKLCALKSMNINTTPGQAFNTVFDGTIPIITVRMVFNELTALTRGDFRVNDKL